MEQGTQRMSHQFRFRHIVNEPERGCGYRRVAGLYLVSDEVPQTTCGKMPFRLTVCPCCGQGIKPARGWTWINPSELLGHGPCREESSCRRCINAHPPEQAGLLWVGGTFYPTVESFVREGYERGISRRIVHIPREFVIGTTWVYFAHRNCTGIDCGACRGRGWTTVAGDGQEEQMPCTVCNATGLVAGIFGAFQPQRIEYIVSGYETIRKVAGLIERGVTLIEMTRDDEHGESTDMSGPLYTAMTEEGVDGLDHLVDEIRYERFGQE